MDRHGSVPRYASKIIPWERVRQPAELPFFLQRGALSNHGSHGFPNRGTVPSLEALVFACRSLAVGRRARRPRSATTPCPQPALRTMDRIFLAVIVSGLLLLTGAFGLVLRGLGPDVSAERSLLMPSVVPLSQPSESGTVGQSDRPASRPQRTTEPPSSR